MPLYSDILLSPEEGADKAPKRDVDTPTKSTAPSASMRMLQEHLMSKKRAKQAANVPVHKIQRLADKSQIPVNVEIKYSEFDWDPFDEYDPMAPNSYEILQLEALKAEERKLNATKNSAAKIDPSILDVLDRFDDEDSAFIRGAAVGPPPTLQGKKSECEASDPGAPKNGQTIATSSDKLDGATAAAKIMAKMGFKAGQGLGRNEQGMNAPLEVEKKGSSQGRIVQGTMTPSKVETQSGASRVLLLQNMVGPGEVDDELEEETKMECMKYGNVVKCLIYEIPNKKVPDDEAVRIFIEFDDPTQAMKAATDLNGRYFGGRVVRASFYDVDKFHKYELGP